MAFSNTILPNVAPVTQGGPLVNAMQGMNALTKGNLENQKNALINQWLPPEMQAKIRQQTSPMSLFGPNAGILSYLNALKAGGAGTQPQSIPQANSNPLSQLLGQGLISRLFGGGVNGLMMPTTNGAQPSQNALTNNPATSGPLGSGNTNAVSGDMGANNQATPGEVTTAANRMDKSTNLSTDYNDPNSPGYQYAHPQQYAANLQTATTGATNEANNMNSLYHQGKLWSDNGPRIETDIQRIQDAMQHAASWTVGPKGGHVAQWIANSPYRDTIEKAKADLATLLAPALNNAHPAFGNLGVAMSLKPDELMTREGLNELSEFSKGWNQRSQDFLPMWQRLKKAGASSDEITTAFNNLNTHDPFFDVGSHKAAGEGAYKNYSTPEALNESRTYGEINPYRGYTKFKINGGTQVVPPTQMKSFMKAHPEAKKVGNYGG